MRKFIFSCVMPSQRRSSPRADLREYEDTYYIKNLGLQKRLIPRQSDRPSDERQGQFQAFKDFDAEEDGMERSVSDGASSELPINRATGSLSSATTTATTVLVPTEASKRSSDVGRLESISIRDDASEEKECCKKECHPIQESEYFVHSEKEFLKPFPESQHEEPANFKETKNKLTSKASKKDQYSVKKIICMVISSEDSRKEPESMRNAFELHTEVTCLQTGETREELLNRVKWISKWPYSSENCLVFILTAPGSEKGVLLKDGKWTPVQEIMEYFSFLTSTPKVFICYLDASNLPHDSYVRDSMSTDDIPDQESKLITQNVVVVQVHRDGETDDIPMYADELLRVSKERRGEKDDVLKWATMINGNLGGRVMTCFNLEKSLYFVPKD